MAYFWRKRCYPKGDYYQIILNEYDSVSKQNKCVKTISYGYADDIVKKHGSDIVSFLNSEVDRLNQKHNPSPQIDSVSKSYYVGHFLLKSMFDSLDLKGVFKLINIDYHPNLDIYDFFKTMCYAQALAPGSKYKLFESVIPNIFGSCSFSYDQILDNTSHIGKDYLKYIEILNDGINRKFGRDTSKVFFDCTNYFFEIDLQDDFKRKGPSKENRKSPLIGQALMLDANQIPIGMQLYPGNQSEKPFLRKMISDMKDRYNVSGKTIQIADKGLNCAKNIYAASIEANDGYIFSKSIHGNGLSDIEKKWLLLSDNDSNLWSDVRDKNGRLIFKYKSCIDNFNYSFDDDEGKKVIFSIKEKRIVTYNPSLARKKLREIEKEVEKVSLKLSLKEYSKDEFDDSIKYVLFPKDNGKTIKGVLNIDKIEEDKRLAGYNLLVTSELSMPDIDVYHAYHGLWRIEHFFRMLKSYLNERPVFVHLKETIYGHFLIGYYVITLVRLLEFYIFNDQISEEELFDFMRQYKVTKYADDRFVNTSCSCDTYQFVKDTFALSKLGNVFLTSKDINNILNAYIDYSIPK